MKCHHQPAKPLQLLSCWLQTSSTLKEKKTLQFNFQANQSTQTSSDDSFKSFAGTFSPQRFLSQFQLCFRETRASSQLVALTLEQHGQRQESGHFHALPPTLGANPHQHTSALTFNILPCKLLGPTVRDQAIRGELTWHHMKLNKCLVPTTAERKPEPAPDFWPLVAQEFSHLRSSSWTGTKQDSSTTTQGLSWGHHPHLAESKASFACQEEIQW